MKKFILVLRKIPLVILVIITMLVLSLVGNLGKIGPYKDLSYDFFKKPAVSLVFQGIHDDIYPWTVLPDEEPSEEITADASDDENWDEAGESEADNDEKTGKADTNDDAATVSGVEEISSGYAYVTVYDEAKATGKSADQIIADRKAASKDTFVYADKIPDGVNSPVVDAYDYGVMNMAYLDPEGTKYKPKKKTYFKKNHEFYLQTEAEDDSYFDDAVFIGDSRTAGLADYGNLTAHASYFATESLTIYDIMESSLSLRTPNGEEKAAKLPNVLKKHTYKKIYFCIGINELGNVGTKPFYEKYAEVIGQIRELQPNAVIYVQGIMHESKKMSSKDPVFNNKNVLEKNRAIATLANGHDIFYLDMNEAVCDGDGNLIDDYTNDGIHLKASEYVRWEDWLRAHVIYPAY